MRATSSAAQSFPKGFPARHVEAETIDADLLAFIKG
jgi:hypothetical protein